MILVEFNGLPGCGKSTVRDILYSEMKTNGYNCVTYESVHEKIPRNIFKAILYAIKNWNFAEIISFIKISNNVEFSSFVEQIKRVLAAEQICVNYRKMIKQNGICLIDQGLLQAIASVIYIYKIKNIQLMEELILGVIKRYDKSLMIVCSVLNVETARERIRFRNFDHGSRFNTITDDRELIGMLEKQNNNIEFVRSVAQKINMEWIEIDMTIEAKKNAETLMKGILDDVSKNRKNSK